MAKNIYLSVVIPAYNEEENIKSGSLKQVSDYLKRQKYSWEVIVVDDGSTDGTARLAEKFAKRSDGFRVLKKRHKGKARTVIEGMLDAKGDIVLFTDMDQATPIDQVSKFLREFESGADVVIGSRTGRKGAPVVRKLMALGFMVLRTVVLRLPYRDTQCGCKAFTRESAREIFSRLKVFGDRQEVKGAQVNAGFDLEVLYVARKLGLRVVEVPVKWQHKGTVRVNPLRDSVYGLRDLLRVRMNAIRGMYKV